MPVPYLGNVLKGWAKKTKITVITQTVVDHETVESKSDNVYLANFQPMPAAKVNRKPEEQRTWKWWSVIIKDKTVLFSTDDIIEESFGKFFGFVSYDEPTPYNNVVGFISYDNDTLQGANFLRYGTDLSARKFRIEQANDWRSSGFTKYEVVEDYT